MAYLQSKLLYGHQLRDNLRRFRVKVGYGNATVKWLKIIILFPIKNMVESIEVHLNRIIVCKNK